MSTYFESSLNVISALAVGSSSAIYSVAAGTQWLPVFLLLFVVYQLGIAVGLSRARQ